MTCPKCQGLMIEEVVSWRCLNCGAQVFKGDEPLSKGGRPDALKRNPMLRQILNGTV